MKQLSAWGLGLVASLNLAHAQDWLAEWDLDQQISVEYNHYFQPAQRPGAEDQSWSAAWLADAYKAWDNDQQSFSLKLFARLDQHDDRRSHFDVREASWLWVGQQTELRIGVGRVFWGTTEAVHLVNIINQTDLVDDVDREEKLGQPMINLTLVNDIGNLDLFVLPYFRERTFVGPEGRPAFPFSIDEDHARYASSAEETHLDYAIRWSQTIGSLDYGISWFKGTAREPRLLPCFAQNSLIPGTANGPLCDSPLLALNPGPLVSALLNFANQLGLGLNNPAIAQLLNNNLTLVPHYDQIEQFGLDVQFVSEALILKLEGIYREQLGQRHVAAAAGLEYTFVGIGSSAIDLSLLAEYLYDERDYYLPNLFDQDYFFGLQVNMNDVQSTLFTMGLIVDAHDHSRLLTMELNRRIWDDWTVSVEGRFFSRIPAEQPAGFLNNEDHWRITLTRYF